LKTGGVVVWDVGDELEAVGEWGDDEGIVKGEWSLEEIEADGA
jgi:hypothetical protein